MKVIQLHINETQLIQKAVRQDREAQKFLYKRFAPKMLSVCRMYVKDVQYAEDVLLKGFFKVFKNLKNFRKEGSFEGWIRRIMVREAIDFLRSQKRWVFTEDFKNENNHQPEDIFFAKSEIESLQYYIDRLPEGYKAVLILYAVEGYKHAEISKMLGISEGTSKSQLSKARRFLREEWDEKIKKEYGNENF